MLKCLIINIMESVGEKKGFSMVILIALYLPLFTSKMSSINQSDSVGFMSTLSLYLLINKQFDKDIMIKVP